MSIRCIYLSLGAVGNVGKTTVARHVLAPGAKAEVRTVETRSGDGAGAIASGELVAYLFSPPPEGAVIDIGVGDTADALAALTLVGRQDSSLPARLRIVVPMLGDAKSVAGLRWLLGQLPDGLCPVVRACWNRVRRREPIREDLVRAIRAVVKTTGAMLCSSMLHESSLFDPSHPLVRTYGSLAAVAALPDEQIRAASLSDIPALLSARDSAQAAVADCRAVFAALNE